MKHNLKTFPPRMLYDFRKNYDLKEHIRLIYLWKRNLREELQQLKQNKNRIAEGNQKYIAIDEVLGENQQ